MPEATDYEVGGRTVSVWHATADSIPAVAAAGQPLTAPGAGELDVCVVGAGIAGLTSAYLLAKAGKRVVVLDQHGIGTGETGRTSAHLASILDDRFKHVNRMHGADQARLLHESHAVAIDLIEKITRDERIDCDFARVPAFLFLGADQAASELGEEYDAAVAAGVAGMSRVDAVPGLGSVPAIRFESQAQFHPLKYLHGLARSLDRLGVGIHGGRQVVDMTGDGPVTIRTADGVTFTAGAGIAATNVPAPINNWAGIYTKQAAYRTYVVGLELGAAMLGEALYWDMEDPYHYVRLVMTHGSPVVLVGGEDHRTGQDHGTDPASRLDRLEQWARRRIPGIGKRVSQWSGQVNEPDDGVAFIGRVPTRDHGGCYVVSGDSGMGLTHGTLGAIIVADLIQGKHNLWADIYDPARKATAAVRQFVRENLAAAAQLKDYLLPGDVSSIDRIAPDEGAVIRRGLHRVAVYRAPDGQVHECSAVCPHLKCVVHWNSLEKTWNCPCHGSRFDPHGKVLMGPAVDPLGSSERSVETY
ncbi:MAG: FAD-dependent oxidoreductase [Phycisphaerae bacterium]